MRYFLFPVARLTHRQREVAIAARLVLPRRPRPRRATGGGAASARAVTIAAVAATAQEENLAAADTDDEAQRVHGPARPEKNWT